MTWIIHNNCYSENVGAGGTSIISYISLMVNTNIGQQLVELTLESQRLVNDAETDSETTLRPMMYKTIWQIWVDLQCDKGCIVLKMYHYLQLSTLLAAAALFKPNNTII